MSFKGEVKASAGWNWNEGAIDNDRLDYAEQLLDGNGDNQAEAAWHETSQTLLQATSTTLDLSNLTRTVLGDAHAVTFLTVKALLIVNEGTGTGELIVGAAASNVWSAPFGSATDTVVVPPDSPLLLVNRKGGWAVDASNQNLKLTAAVDDVTYSIALLGTITAAGSGS